MSDFLNWYLKEAPDDFAGEAATPAGEHLFNVRMESMKLDDERTGVFHRIKAGKRSRSDIQLAVGFLCSSVRVPYEDDWKKLRRLIQYLHATSVLLLTLETDESHVVKWRIDAAFAVHQDMKS